MNNRNKQINNKVNYNGKTKRVIISTALVASLLFSGSMINASIASPTASSSVEAASTSNIKYNDFQATQYWANDMLWAVDQGLIQGYINAKHPTNKNSVTGNWLNPQGNLTEAQMLAVLFRYSKKDELANTKPTVPTWWASTYYQLAAKYNVPTKGSLTNSSALSQVMSRGNLAQALATIHFGKQVTIQQAVQFMYDADISTGLPNKDGSYSRNYNSYGVNDKLTRAHIVAFVKRYEDKVGLGGTVQPAPVVTPPTTGGQVVNGIKVEFGKHTYSSENQTEYDKVNAYVAKAMSGYKNLPLADTEYYQRFLDGDRASNYAHGTADNVGLTFAERSMGHLKKNGVSNDVIADAIKAGRASVALSISVTPKTLTDGSPNSAYHHLFAGITDCDASAQTISAAFDRAGYVTAVVAKPGHAEVVVKVSGKWYMVQGITFGYVTSDLLAKNGYKIFTPATDGSTLN